MLRNILIGISFILSLLYTHQIKAQDKTRSSETSKPIVTGKLTEEQKIQKLISFMKDMEGATFIRNGSNHSAREAAEHIEKKYKNHASRIKTADDFIKHLASKSSASGEPYKIRLANGTELLAGDVLNKELQRLNNIAAAE